jgi:hypothetical protein
MFSTTMYDAEVRYRREQLRRNIAGRRTKSTVRRQWRTR